MTVTSYPGVYVEEISGGARPIESAGTSTAAFFGVADRGPIGEVHKIFGFDAFEKLYGSFRSDEHCLAHAVFAFFNNGGRDCYVGRVANGYRTASITVRDRSSAARNSLTIAASSPGVWGNTLLVLIESDAAQPNSFKLTVKDEVPDPDTGGKKIIDYEAYENLSMDPNATRFVEAVINNSSSYIRVVAKDTKDNNASADTGFSESGVIIGAEDGLDFIASGQRKFRINIDGDGWRTVDISSAMEGKNVKRLQDIRTALLKAVNALLPLRGTNREVYSGVTVDVVVPDPNKPSERKLRISSGSKRVSSRVEILPVDSSDESLTGALRLGPRSGGTEAYGHATMRPMDTAKEPGYTAPEYYLVGDDTLDARVSEVVLGDDGTLPQPGDYADAFHWLDKITDVSLIAVPGVGAWLVADSGMSYCRNRPLSDCFFIADMPSHYTTLEEAKGYARDINTPNSYGAVYFPWLQIPDPTGKSPALIPVPPSGFVAGLYAQTDARRGVWKAPAGLEVALAGAVGMTAELTDQQHGDLNKQPKSVCVIRKFAGSGLVLWGARTLSTDAEYKYIPVRRTAILLRKSIYNGIQWAVFESNDERLWSSLRLNIGSFMNGLFRAGAFQGSKASDAYFVRCGLGDTMTQDDIDRGEVIVLVGFAPLKPAEFIIVRIQQKIGQGGG